MRRLKVLIADDHELMVEAIRMVLDQTAEEFEIVAVTSRDSSSFPPSYGTQAMRRPATPWARMKLLPSSHAFRAMSTDDRRPGFHAKNQ